MCGRVLYGALEKSILNLVVGQTATRTLTLTPEHVLKYAEITGDYNPLHFDEAFAAQTKFGRLVAQGGLTTGPLHALVAMDMPGAGTVFLSQNWKFTAPVFIGDTITATVTILAIHVKKPVTQLRRWLHRISHHAQDGETVLKAKRGVTRFRFSTLLFSTHSEPNPSWFGSLFFARALQSLLELSPKEIGQRMMSG